MKTLIVILIILSCLGASLWMLNAMGIFNIPGFIINTLSDVPVISDHLKLYQLGITRSEDIEQSKEELAQEKRLLEAEKEQYILMQNQIVNEWRLIQQEKEKLNQEWERLSKELEAMETTKLQSKDFSQLLSVIELMKPKDIAAMAEDMEDSLLIQILFGIDQRAASQVLAEIEPTRAAILTDIIFKEGR